MAKAKKDKKDVAEIITERFVEALKRGETPWVKPWDDWFAWSGIDGHAYRGMNALLLETGEWVTWKEIQNRGIKVNKGEHYSIVVNYSEYDKEVSEEEYENMKEKSPSYYGYMEKVGAVTRCDGFVKIHKRSLRYYKVWNVESQTDGKIKYEHACEKHEWDSIEQAETVANEYIKREKIFKYEGGNVAYNSSSGGMVVLPEREQFEKATEFYSTMFHELVHSTSKAVGRDLSQYHKDKKARAREELVAEIGAAYIMSYLGIEEEFQMGNSEAYCQNWGKVLGSDPNAILYAAPKAIEAANYILGIKQEV